jgi:hypothetical protein
MINSEVKKIYTGIWYRENAPKERSLEDAFKRDRGKLLIGDKSIEYSGKKNNFKIENIQALHFGLQGSDPVNPYIKVTFSHDGSTKTAYFADGKFFGYAGVLGGTYRIFKRLITLVPYGRTITYSHSYLVMHLFLLVVLIVLLLKIFYF